MSGHANYAPTMGCLSEHLEYFNENIAGGFDDIFNKDFDLLFDPVLLMNNGEQVSVASEACTVARPVYPQQMVQEQQAMPVPVSVPSSYSAQSMPVPVQATSNPYAAPVSPAVAPKPMVKPVAKPAPRPAAPRTNIRKVEPAVVSPTSVTAVFTSIPTPTVAKSSPRKRSYSMAAESAPAPEPADVSHLSFQEQEDLRRERNRHHAKRSRQRKRNYMTQLEEAVNEMRKENERLFDLLHMDSTRAKADMAKEQERKSERATEKFIAGLRQPRNRVLDNTTLAFLRELWK